MKNLLTDLPPTKNEEIFEKIIQHPHFTLERIITSGQHTPEGQWYDQHQDEWVIVIQGQAQLDFEDGEQHTMQAGDSLHIPAHRRHRVTWSDPKKNTIWLVLHYKNEKIEEKL